MADHRINRLVLAAAVADFCNKIGHFQTHAAQRSGALRFYPSIPTRLRPAHSFDHLVGNRKQIGREAEKKFGSPLVDNPFELGRLNDQKLSG
jgi:hypothetical protein